METQEPIKEILPTPVVSCSLKRKRPPQIAIPNVLQEIQPQNLNFSHFTPQNEPFCFGGIGVAVSSIKGKKKFMEDTHKIFSCLNGTSNTSFFGVYDGHGGQKAAEFVAENLHTNIVEMMVKCSETGGGSKEEAVKSGYLKTDQEFLKQGVVSGACCVTAFIEGQDVVVSNLGDCRAVLCRGGIAETLTKDHRAEREDERKRIENKGGYVEIHRGGWRVHGILSVTRSIGDAHLKDWVVAEPDTMILQLSSDMEFLVLASDGLWEEVGNQEAVDTVIRCCMPEKKSSSTDTKKDDYAHYGCVNVSPSSKLKRVSLVKRKGLKHSPCEKKAMGGQKDMQDFPSEHGSPSSKLRVPIVKKTVNSCNGEEDDFPSENGSPPSKLRRIFPSENESPPSKLRRVSMLNPINIKADLPIKDAGVHKKIIPTYIGLANMQDDFPSENESPSSKTRRISLLNQINIKADSPIINTSVYHKMIPTSTGLADMQDNFPSENESPLSKSRKISLVNQINIKAVSPINEKCVPKKMIPTSTGLVAACKELVNLAVSRERGTKEFEISVL
ncbi:Protein phosphatase 2C family protein [Euphorbia peplus]|nr:Protein phosphatase 2C family protein [Euphorbia peplus]